MEDDGVGAGVVELADELEGGLDFVVEEEGVDGGVEACVVEVGVAGELLDVGDGVGGGDSGSEGGGSDVDGVGAVVDGVAALFEVFGWGE